jgi:adenylate cyclase, class 2
MKIRSFEFKAKADIKLLEYKLQQLNPVWKGNDKQTDTYFNVPHGRLKLREGQIENALIYYNRENVKRTKLSDVMLYKHTPGEGLKDILTELHGIKVIVEKTRSIYFVNNVKIHFDTVAGLGTFIEVEALDETGERSLEMLQEQCNEFLHLFGIQDGDLLSSSYSDMLINFEQ